MLALRQFFKMVAFLCLLLKNNYSKTVVLGQYNQVNNRVNSGVYDCK